MSRHSKRTKTGLLAGLSARPTLVTKATTFGMWLLLLSGSVLSGGALVLVSSADAAPVVPKSQEIGPSGFAELYVAAFLAAGNGNEENLRIWYPGAPDLQDVKPNARYAARTAALQVTAVTPTYWSVTVAADVLGTEGAEVRSLGTNAYRVAIVNDAGRYVATGLPAQIPLPLAGGEPRTRFGDFRSPTAEPALKGSIEGFLRAYVAGAGDLERFVSPASVFVPVTPAPFTTVELLGLAVMPEIDGTGSRVVNVRVLATDSAARAQILEYGLRLSQRDGRWEVADVLEAPPLVSPTVGETVSK